MIASISTLSSVADRHTVDRLKCISQRAACSELTYVLNKALHVPDTGPHVLEKALELEEAVVASPLLLSRSIQTGA